MSACGAPPQPPDAGAMAWPEGTLELGGEASGEFVTLPMNVEAAPGSQGGYHVAVMYRVSGKTAPLVLFEHRVTRVRDNTLVSKGNRTLSVEGDSWVSPGPVIIFICPTPIGVNVLGEELHFEVTASQKGELLGRASANAVFGCRADDSFCASICAG